MLIRNFVISLGCLKFINKLYQSRLTSRVLGCILKKKQKISIKPGKEDQGIVFKRIDLKTNNLIYGKFDKVSSAKLCTTLENDKGVKVSTVEHLLAALYMAEIDNALIEINNEEVPIMDGSAKDFLKELQKIDLKKDQQKKENI